VTTSLMVLLVLYAVLLGVGQILFKMAAETARERGGGFLLALVFEPKFIVAIILYGGLTILWTWILSKVPLSRAYPFVALAFVITPVLAHVLLGEPLPIAVIGGTVLVMLGLVVVIYAR
jgi:drug/metabolite transporter (DMT)-like permease